MLKISCKALTILGQRVSSIESESPRTPEEIQEMKRQFWEMLDTVEQIQYEIKVFLESGRTEQECYRILDLL